MFINLLNNAYDVQFDAQNQQLMYAKRVDDNTELTLDELDALNQAIEGQIDEIFAEEIVEHRFNSWTGYM
jgi:hypothetical protein